MGETKLSDQAAIKLINAYEKCNHLSRITMFQSSTFLQSEENIQLLIRFILRQNYLQELYLGKLEMDFNSATIVIDNLSLFNSLSYLGLQSLQKLL